MEILMTIAVIVFIPVCVLLVLTILLQDSKGGGLSSSAFGASEMQSILGGKGSADFLTKLTTGTAIAFLLISLLLMRFYGNTGSGLKVIPSATQSETTTDEALEAPPADGAETDNEEATDNQAETDNQTEADNQESESTDETTEPAETEQ